MNKNKIIISFLTIFFIQQSSSSSYGIESFIEPQEESTSAFSIDWIDVATLNNDKVLVATSELSDHETTKTFCYLKIFNLITGKLENKLKLKENIEINQAFFHPYSRYVYALFNKSSIAIIDLHNEGESLIKKKYDVNNLTCAGLSPTGEVLVVAGGNGYLAFLNPLDLAEQKNLTQPIDGHQTITALNFNKNGSHLITAHQTANSSLIHVWDAKNSNIIYTIKKGNLWQNNNIRSIQINPLNENIFILTVVNKIYTFDTDKPENNFYYKNFPDFLGVDSEGTMITINKRGELRKITPGNKYKIKISDDKIEPNKRTPIATFTCTDNSKTIIAASEFDGIATKPTIKIYKEKPSFLDIQKRQFTGAFLKLKKPKI